MTQARLTPRQTLFADACAQGKSYTDAARIAGFRETDSYPSQLAKRPHIAKAIEAAISRYRKTTELTADQWRIELAYQYQQTREQADTANALRALELWGKHLGLLDTRSDTGGAEALARVLALLAGPRALPAPITGLQVRELPDTTADTTEPPRTP